ncbi:hypothetical protein OXX80_001685 [Metschnikowia pulcherrima]
MALGKCGICTENQAKYKCPTCSIEYCSLPCFKSEKHDHNNLSSANSVEKLPGSAMQISEPIQPKETPPIFEKIANDPIIRSLLKYKSLQTHLSILLKLLSDSSLTREPIFENRKEIVNMRLCDLRIGGPEENELVEEFVQRVLILHDEAQNGC